MKLKTLNLKGKSQLLDEFELKSIRGGYYQTSGCNGVGSCNGGCNSTHVCRDVTISSVRGCYCSEY